MKKVVLLAGALAAGMAIAPQAANAAAPTAPGVDEINLTADEINNVKISAQNYLQKLKDLKASPTVFAAAVESDDQVIINNAISDLENLISECGKLVDSPNNSDYFVENNNEYVGGAWRVRGTLIVNPNDASVQIWVRRYASSSFTRFNATIEDLEGLMEAYAEPAFTRAQAAVVAALGAMSPADIKAANAALEADIKASDDYKHLVEVLKEAADIIDDVNPNPLYADQLFDDVKTAAYDAHLKDGAMKSAEGLLAKIEELSETDDAVVSKLVIEADLAIVGPELEGLLNDFKIQANAAAAKAIQDYVDTKFNGDDIDALIEGLQHHLDETATCFDTDSHVIADNADVVADKAQLATDLGALEPDATWNAMGHDAADASLDRALSTPAAVQVWYDIQQGNTNTIDNDLTNLETTVYTACLTYDLEDIYAALQELSGAEYTGDLEDGELKDWLSDALDNGGYFGGQYEDLEDEFTNHLFMGDIDASDFADAEAKVDKLEKTLANIKANWADIESLNDAVVELQGDIDAAATDKGNTSTAIQNKWSDEQTELDTLVGDIEDAIKAINDEPAADPVKAGKWVGLGDAEDDATFAGRIAVENDHHDWLLAYQYANYEAQQTMLTEIRNREKEYDAVRFYHIDSTDAENPNDLGVYTTDDNKGVALESIKGEDDPSKFIYAEAFLNEIAEHFGNNDATVDAAVIATDGKPVDLLNDLINKWYDDADAEYIGAKTYAAGWAEAEHAGQLKTNTTAGFDIDSTDDQAMVKTLTPAAKDAVVFGWLQTEIQNAFAKALENEKANKDLHDLIDGVQDYVDDAAKDINDNAHLMVELKKQDIEEYDIWSRETTTNTFLTDTYSPGILYPGTAVRVGHKTAEELTDDYKTEGGTAIVPATPTVNYLKDFTCGHGIDVWGWDTIDDKIAKLWEDEQKAYDVIGSKALLESGDVQEVIEDIEENVELIKNEAYTQVIENAFASVNTAINDARTWAAKLDYVCHEYTGVKPCSDEDIKNNPCGWDEPEAKAALEALIADYNEKLQLLRDEHEAEKNDDHATPIVDDDNIKEFAGYLQTMLDNLNAWKVKFAAADMKHKKALNEAYDLAESEAHTVHHYSFDAKAAAVNFSEDGADAATADNWAKDFNTRVIGTYDGEEVTFQQFVKKIDDKMVADIYSAIHDEDPDVYAAIKNVADNGIETFDDYITATENLGTFVTAVANYYLNNHLYTELKKLAEGMKNFNWEADFNKWIEANKDAYAELKGNLQNVADEFGAVLEDIQINGGMYEIEVEGDNNDALDLQQPIQDFQTKTLADAYTALETAYTTGKLVTEDQKSGLEETVAGVKDELFNLKEAIAQVRAFYTAEHELAADYKAQLANLETLLKSVVPGDVFEDVDDYADEGKGDLKFYKKLLDEIYNTEADNLGLIQKESADIDTDLDNAEVQANKVDHEKALKNIEDKITALQQAVKDIEKFKHDNQVRALELRDQIVALGAEIDAIVVEGVYADLSAASDEVKALGYADAKTINTMIDDLKFGDEDGYYYDEDGEDFYAIGYMLDEIQSDLDNGAALYYTDGEGGEYWNYNAHIAAYTKAIKEIRAALADAKAFYAANLDVKNTLDQRISAVDDEIATTKAFSTCEDCNDEDGKVLEGLADDAFDLRGDVQDAFDAAELAPAGKTVEDLMGSVADLESDLANIKAEIIKHNKKVDDSNLAYKNIMDRVNGLNFEIIAAKVEMGEGANNFLVKDPTNCNPEVLYFDEIEKEIQDLKNLLAAQNSHDGKLLDEDGEVIVDVEEGHCVADNITADLLEIKAIQQHIADLVAASAANDAAHELIQEAYGEVAEAVSDMLDQFANYDAAIFDNTDLGKQVVALTGTIDEPGLLQQYAEQLHNDYLHGSDAYKYTVDAKGKELTEEVLEDVQTQLELVKGLRNLGAKKQAEYHLGQANKALADVDDAYINENSEFNGDPFVLEVAQEYAPQVELLKNVVNNIQLMIDGYYEDDTQTALEEHLGLDEAADAESENIHPLILALEDLIEEIDGNLELAVEDAHHLTNAKTIFSDQEYFTIGFFQKANDGSETQGQEMFQTVKVNGYDPEDPNINIFDMTYLETEWTDGEDGVAFTDDDEEVAVRDEQGHLVHQVADYAKIAEEISVLNNGTKKNELSFLFRDHSTKTPEVWTLAAGPADITFEAGSLTVNDAVRTAGEDWTTTHPVFIEVEVTAPEVEERVIVDVEEAAEGESAKLVVRLDAPVDLTYTINSLVARTDNGEEFSYADRQINNGAIEFALPAGTNFVELPEGFFTFRTGANTIARSAAATVFVGNTTSIEGLIALGEKAEIYDLQGRRVKAESLVRGNAYVINGTKQIVK